MQPEECFVALLQTVTPFCFQQHQVKSTREKAMNESAGGKPCIGEALDIVACCCGFDFLQFFAR